MASDVKILDVIMCDEVRTEDNGKKIFIGVFLDNIGVPSLPVTLPKLTFVIRMIPHVEKLQMVFTIQDPLNVTMIKGRGTLELSKVTSPARAMFEFGIMPFRLKEPGLHRLLLSVNGRRSSKIYEFMVLDKPPQDIPSDN